MSTQNDWFFDMFQENVVVHNWNILSEEERYRLWSEYFVSTPSPHPLMYFAWYDVMEAAHKEA